MRIEPAMRAPKIAAPPPTIRPSCIGENSALLGATASARTTALGEGVDDGTADAYIHI